MNTRPHLSSFPYHCRPLSSCITDQCLCYCVWGEKDCGRLAGGWVPSANKRSLHHYRLPRSHDACLGLLMGWWGGVLRNGRNRLTFVCVCVWGWQENECKWANLHRWVCVLLGYLTCCFFWIGSGKRQANYSFTISLWVVCLWPIMLFVDGSLNMNKWPIFFYILHDLVLFICSGKQIRKKQMP